MAACIRSWPSIAIRREKNSTRWFPTGRRPVLLYKDARDRLSTNTLGQQFLSAADARSLKCNPIFNRIKSQTMRDRCCSLRGGFHPRLCFLSRLQHSSTRNGTMDAMSIRGSGIGHVGRDGNSRSGFVFPPAVLHPKISFES